MRFVIRDDDTNYFTRPEQLDEVYRGVWDRHPVSLAVVPFHGCTLSGAIPEAVWTGEGRFPLHHNARLADFLRRRIRQGRVSILQHGFDHVDRGGRAEFEAERAASLLKRIVRGRRYLEDLLETSITTFVPPHNSMSRAALAALDLAGMNVMGSFSFRPGLRPIALANLPPMARRRVFLWRQRRHGWRGRVYPYPLHVAGHQELGCHDLNRDFSCRLEELAARLDQTARVNGDFCLATHYWELRQPPLHAWLASLLKQAASRGAVFVSADDLFGERRHAATEQAA